MRKCVIFGSMPVGHEALAYVNDADAIYCVDAGYRNARALGLQPDLVAGDFDSMPQPDTDIATVVLPTHKDVTDTFFAAQKALENGAQEVCLLGCTGGRLDHTVANFHTLLMLAQHGVHAVMADANTRVYALWQSCLTLPREENMYLSLFPAGDKAKGVCAEGVEYPLQKACLTNTYPVGVSNEFVDAQATISVESGGLFVILARR